MPKKRILNDFKITGTQVYLHILWHLRECEKSHEGTEILAMEKEKYHGIHTMYEALDVFFTVLYLI